MALVKPIVNEIVAFDATVGTTITFIANGGDQITGNQIKIVTNSGSTETTVYTNTVTSYELSHIIPASIGLQNGNYYKLMVRTLDILGNTSEWSNYQPFYCYTTPTLSFNLYEGQTLRVSNYNVVLTYSQNESEKVDYAIIKLYNANNVLISSSGNLYNSTTPPLTFSTTISRLENHSQYNLEGTVVTVNGTIVKTTVKFYVNFNTIIADTDLTLTLDACNGFVNARSSMISNLVGKSNPTPATYIDYEMVDLLCPPDIENERYSKWVKWDDGLLIPTNFLLRLWFYPAKQPYHILTLKNIYNNDYLNIVMNRSATEDYITIDTNNGTHIDESLGVHCNGNTKVFLWLKIVDDVWTVQTQVLSTETTVIEWESSHNNIKYNVDSDIPWNTEPLGDYIPSTNTYAPLNDEMNYLKIGNGIFDNLNLTKDTDIPYSTSVPVWNDDTILCINFNGNLDNNGAPHYTKLVLKRKDDSLLSWLTLSEKDVTEYNKGVYIDFNDSFIPTGIEQTYALVTYIDNIPSEPVTEKITPHWSKYFLSDRNNRFVLNYAVIYSGHNQNIQNGVFMPIGAKYPIVIQNANGNYRSGSLQFKVLGYQYEINQRLDRISIKNQLDDILAFLTNGTAKCLTDFNGNIFIIKVINSPQIAYDANWGNGIASVSFDWVEQTEYNNYEGMLELGLFDYIVTN